MLHALHIGHADGLSRLNLASGNGCDAGPDDFAHIGTGIEAKSDDAAFQLIQTPIKQRQCWQAEIDQIYLDQQRGGSNGLHITGRDTPHHRFLTTSA